VTSLQKWPTSKVDRSPLPSAKVKNDGAISSLPIFFIVLHYAQGLYLFTFTYMKGDITTTTKNKSDISLASTSHKISTILLSRM
jgi:hypothetical protein